MLLHQILVCNMHDKYKKYHAKTISLKYLGQLGMTNLNYLMDHLPYQIFKIILII